MVVRQINAAIIVLVLAITGCALLKSPVLPEGWVAGCTTPYNYHMGIDSMCLHSGNTPLYVKWEMPSMRGCGAIESTIDASSYLGKRVRLSGYLKCEDVRVYSAMRLYVFDKSKNILAYDNMYHRHISGSMDWQKFEIVVDVPSTSAKIEYGFFMVGSGITWFDFEKFEVVGDSIKTTQMDLYEKVYFNR